VQDSTHTPPCLGIVGIDEKEEEHTLNELCYEHNYGTGNLDKISSINNLPGNEH
jgi:hypothetical protein